MQPIRWTSAALNSRSAAGVFVACLAAACAPDGTERPYAPPERSSTAGTTVVLPTSVMDGGVTHKDASISQPDVTTAATSPMASEPSRSADASASAEPTAEPPPSALTSVGDDERDASVPPMPDASTSPMPDAAMSTLPEASTSPVPSSPLPSASAMPSMAPTTPSPNDVKASAGCTNGSGSGTPVISNSLVDIPPGYDGETPVPVVFTFHATSNPSTQLQVAFAGTALPEKYLLVHLGATIPANAWNDPRDRTRFDTAYDELLTNACVDENRIHAVGHSAGAQFVVQLLCDGDERFRAVAPIASSVFCSSWTPVAALVIHGTADAVRADLNDGDGRKDIVPYATSNGCEMTTQPSSLDVAGCSDTINPGCVDYDGCETPVTWCNHDDPFYNNTNHGIPCFAASAIFDFFETHEGS